MLSYPTQSTLNVMESPQETQTVESGQGQPQLPARTSRKRKTPPASSEPTLPSLQPPPPPHLHHMLMHPLPPGYAYAPPPGDYSPGGIPPAIASPTPQPTDATANSAAGRALSNSKRAEQNRKAQRAFRERRDQYVF